MIPSAPARKRVAYIRFKKKGRTGGTEEGRKDADRLMHTHVINTAPCGGQDSFWETLAFYPSDWNENNKGAVVVEGSNEEAR